MKLMIKTFDQLWNVLHSLAAMILLRKSTVEETIFEVSLPTI